MGWFMTTATATFPQSHADVDLSRGAARVVAVASTVAAVVHVLVAPEHFAESRLYGWFFVATAAAGFGYAVWVLVRPSRWLLRTGVVANAAIVSLWLFTRLVAVPVGPGAGETEPFGALDVLASSAEVVVVLAALLALARWVSAGAAPVRRTNARVRSGGGSASTAAGEGAPAAT
jgi:hypothetical protein